MKSNKKYLRFLITAGAVFLVSVVLQFSGITGWFERKSYDMRMSATADAFEPSEDITLVLLDQESLNWASETLGWSYPWPRESYAKIIDFFNRANAASIAFDMLYTEPSMYGPEDDRILGEACSNFGRVIETVYYSPEATKIASGDGTEYPAPLYPVDDIKNNAAILGNVTSSLDGDGTARRNRFYSTSPLAEPGLAVASLIVGENLPDLKKIPLASDGGMYIRFQRSLDNYIPYNAEQIIRTELAIEEAEKNGEEFDPGDDLLDLEQFEGSHVFFGLYAPGLFDICTTPIGTNYPGVGVHVCQLDTILNESYLFESPLWVTLLIIALASILGCFIGGVTKQANAKSVLIEVLIFIVVIAAYIGATIGAFIPGLIMPFFVPLLALSGAFIASILETYLTEGKQRRYLKTAFKQYLSPTVIENLIENPDLLKLGGERREITAFFSDIQGFTTISESMTPEGMTQFLNLYLSEMSDIIMAHGGTIDKYEGDAIIAFWNAPTFEEDHAKRGIEAALECQKKLVEMQDELMKITGKPVKQRIGLNTGIATVGNFGSRNRFDYTMMGDTVNLASRLEGINKQYGTYTMCSKATMDSAVEHGFTLPFRNVGKVAVVGRKEPVLIYNPLTTEEKSVLDGFNDIYLKAYDLFEKGDFAEAKEAFASIADKDPVSAKYVDKCAMLIKNPPENWQGFIQATEK